MFSTQAKVKVAQSCPTLWDIGILQARILEWVTTPFSRVSSQPGKPGLPHCRWILYQLSHKGSPRILEWVAYPFSSGSSWPRNQTGVFNSRALHLMNIPMKIALTWRNMWLVTKDCHVLLCSHYLLPRGSQRHYFYEQRLIFPYFGT